MAKGKLQGIHIDRADNGFKVTATHDAATSDSNSPSPYVPEKGMVFSDDDHEGMIKHVHKLTRPQTDTSEKEDFTGDTFRDAIGRAMPLGIRK